jgi:hypothetical protein
MKGMELLSFVVMVIMLAFVGTSSYYFLKVIAKPVTINLNGQTINDIKQYNGDLTDLDILGKRFAKNHKYNLTDYNCVNYSNDYYNIAKDLGFDVGIKSGCKYSNGTICHQWITTQIDYSPQTGEYKDFDTEYPYEVNK